MDRTTKSISSSCNNDDGVPEETGMEKVLSDLQALKKLYGLLQTLDETSKALLKKLLDDATRQALLKQAKALTTTPSDSVIPFSLGLTSPEKMDRATSSSSSFLNNKETEMGQILSDLQALTRLYSLLHKGPADENLDEASRALLMKILEDATQEAVRRQAKMLSASLVSPALERKLSTRSDCRTPPHADPLVRPAVASSPGPSRLASQRSRADPCLMRPVASPRPSILLASEQSRRLNLQHSTVSRWSGLHVDDGHRRHAAAAEEPPPLSRLASKRSSRTTAPARQYRPTSQEPQHSSLSLSLHRFPAAGTSSRHGTVTGGSRLADHRDDSTRRSSSGRGGDQWSLERSNSSRSMSMSGRMSCSRGSVSVSRRELSLGSPPSSSRLHYCRSPVRHVEAAESSSSSAHRLFERRLDSAALSSLRSMASSRRHGVQQHARRRGGGVASPEQRSSSSNSMAATMHSRIRPSNTTLLLTDRSLRRRPAAKQVRTPRGRQQGRDFSSAETNSSSMSSVSRRSSSAAASLSASTSPTASSPVPRAFANPTTAVAPAPRAFATPYYYSPPPPPATATTARGIAPESSRSMRLRRRQEVLEKRVARLRVLKDKIATVFHHRHDHHHHHHIGGQDQAAAGPSSSSRSRSAVVRGGAGHHLLNNNSPWQFLTSMFHHASGKVVKSVNNARKSRTAAAVAAGGVPEKKRRGGGGGGGGGGNVLALFDAVRRHLKTKTTKKKGTRRAAPAAAAGIKLRRKVSRVVRAKKMHWWQRLKQRRGMAGLIAGSKPRRRLGHGKAGWL